MVMHQPSTHQHEKQGTAMNWRTRPRVLQYPRPQRMQRRLQASDVVYERLVRAVQQRRRLRAIYGAAQRTASAQQCLASRSLSDVHW